MTAPVPLVLFCPVCGINVYENPGATVTQASYLLNTRLTGYGASLMVTEVVGVEVTVRCDCDYQLLPFEVTQSQFSLCPWGWAQ